ncbi:hypothetical protein Tco_1368119 [Tanacetum coccineum]
MRKEHEPKEEEDCPEYINTNPPSPPDPSISFITEKVCKLNSFLESLNLVPPSSNTQFVCTKENDGDVMFVELIKTYDDSSEEELGVSENVVTGDELGVGYFDKFPTRSELAFHKYLMYPPILSLFLRNPIIVGGNPSNLKIPCNIGHVHVEKAYIDLNSPINIMTRMQYNWIMRKQLEYKDDPEGIRGISNFTRRIRGMHIFVGNFTYVLDFMIVEDISSVIDPRLSQVVLRRPFIEISNMTNDLSLGIVKFTIGADKTQREGQQENELSNLTRQRQLLASVNYRSAIIEELERLPRNLVAYKTREHLKRIQKAVLVEVIELKKELRLQISFWNYRIDHSLAPPDALDCVGFSFTHFYFILLALIFTLALVTGRRLNLLVE